MSNESPPSWGPPPTVMMICGTVVISLAIAAVVVLTLAGQDPENVFRLVNLGLNALGLLGTTAALLYAGHAARASRATEEKLSNGAISKAVSEAINGEGGIDAVRDSTRDRRV